VTIYHEIIERLNQMKDRPMKSTKIPEAQLEFYAQKLAYEIDSWDLKVAIEKHENIVIIDARSSEAYAKEHIPSAINFPHRMMNTETVVSIDKTALIVVYCDGIGCNASTKGALNMSRLGFHVKELIGGLEWWKRDGHATEGMQSSVSADAGCSCDSK